MNKEKVVRFEIRLSYEEDDKLRLDSLKANLSKSEYVRRLIMGNEIKEKPDDRFYNVMTQLTKIGNNLNQISRKANKTDLIDKDFYKNEAIKWNKFMSNVKEEFL